MSEKNDTLVQVEHLKKYFPIKGVKGPGVQAVEDISIEIKGRHDPIIVPRAVVVVESMAALTVTDLLLSNLGARMEYLEKIYNV